MASVMAIESEVFGSCVEEIVVSVEIVNRSVWLCCGWNYLSFIWQEKWLKISGGGGRWCQVFEVLLGALGVIEELKSPCGGRGVMKLGIYIHQESLSSESHRLLRLPAPLPKSLTELF